MKNKLNNKKNNNKKSLFKKYIFYISILLILSALGVAIYAIIKKYTNRTPGTSTTTPGNTTTTTPGTSTTTPGNTTTTTPGTSTTTQPIKPTPPIGKINGAWAGTIGCGDGTFNLISLASALPQDFNSTSLNDFLGKIAGNYSSDLSNGKTKYIISIGGSAASPAGWTSFFNLLANNNDLISKFVAGLKCRGIVGVDFDLEQTTQAMIPSIISIVNSIKAIDNNFIVMYTILLGSPETFGSLLNTSNYDYLSLMLYNGGMYIAGGSGAGCDWDGWAELILSKGTAGCKTPLGPSYLQTYITAANLAKIDPSKVLLGLIIDTDKLKLSPSILDRANQLIKQYGAGGTMIWVVPGWVNHNTLSDLNAMGFNIDASKCSGSGGTCPPPTNPCQNGKKCIATQCGKTTQGVTDDHCSICSTGVTYWPCGSLNFCQLDDGKPGNTCSY